MNIQSSPNTISNAFGLYVCELNLGWCGCEDRGSFDVASTSTVFSSFVSGLNAGSVLLIVSGGNLHNSAAGGDNATISALGQLGVDFGTNHGYDLTGSSLSAAVVYKGTTTLPLAVWVANTTGSSTNDVTVSGKSTCCNFYQQNTTY